jgi:formate dehydrogenase assembly factor FdhD
MQDANNAAKAYLAKAIEAKQQWRKDQARLSFREKLDILDKLKAASDTFANARACHASRNLDQS